jgi:hypothetical protein
VADRTGSGFVNPTWNWCCDGIFSPFLDDCQHFISNFLCHKYWFFLLQMLSFDVADVPKSSGPCIGSCQALQACRGGGI